MKRVVTIALMAMFLSPLVGCETMKGLGKDIENLGETMQNGADNKE